MKQMFYGSKPQPELFEEVRNSGKVKPFGGLWTSSETYEGSNWKRFVLREGLRRNVSEGWKLEVSSSARVYEISCLEDLEYLPLVRENGEINFESVSMYYDAIHLTTEGVKSLYEHPSLYGWDVECTLWLRWCFDNVEEE